MNTLRQHFQAGRGVNHSTVEDIRAKWVGTVEIPVDLGFYWKLPELRSDNVELFEAFFESEARGSPIGEAVGSADPYDNDYTVPGLQPGRFLDLSVDLSYPLDVLMSLIEQELRRAAEKQPARRKRRRPDKADFYLKVYDLAEKGETFGAIAQTLNKRASTVKSAFLAARRNVFGLTPKAVRYVSPVGPFPAQQVPVEPCSPPSKKAMPLLDFDKDGHVQRCSACQTAERFEDMCAQARRYALQEYSGQRELTGFDTVRGAGDRMSRGEDADEDL